MRCSKAELAIIERTLGMLDERESALLDAHLQSCPLCDAQARIEKRLAGDLALLREEPPFTVDATSAIRSRLEDLGPLTRDDLSTRQLGWAALATLIGGALLLVYLFNSLPQLTRSAQELLAIASSLETVAGSMLSPLLALFSALLVSAERLFATFVGAITALPDLRPLGIAFVAGGCAAMLSTIALVLIRDFRRPTEPASEITGESYQ